MINEVLQGSNVDINLRGDSKIDLNTLNWAVVVYHSDDITNKIVITKSEAVRVQDNLYRVTILGSSTKNMKQGYQNIELKASNGMILSKSNAFIVDVSASKDIEL